MKRVFLSLERALFIYIAAMLHHYKDSKEHLLLFTHCS